MGFYDFGFNMFRLFAFVFFYFLSFSAIANPFSGLFSWGNLPINPSVLKLAQSAYECAVLSGDAKQGSSLTVIDYSLPASKKRMWVLSMPGGRILFNTYVAHGIGSGGLTPSRFSNTPESRKSSIGLYKTGSPYQGQFGYSLRLFGLDPGYNDNAYSRAIVMHGTNYQNGRINPTWGCPAVPKHLAKPIINKIKGGNLVFAYYPNSAWLKKSPYLNCPRRFIATSTYRQKAAV